MSAGYFPMQWSRWACYDGRVWEKRDWGWKFLGYADSLSFCDVTFLPSTDADHPYDIFNEGFFDER